MKFIVKGVHLKVTPALREYIEAHLLAPIGNFYDNEAAELEVHLVDSNGPKGGEDKECRVTLRMPGFKGIHITEASDDIFRSVAQVRDRLEVATKRELEKRREHSPAAQIA